MKLISVEMQFPCRGVTTLAVREGQAFRQGQPQQHETECHAECHHDRASLKTCLSPDAAEASNRLPSRFAKHGRADARNRLHTQEAQKEMSQHAERRLPAITLASESIASCTYPFRFRPQPFRHPDLHSLCQKLRIMSRSFGHLQACTGHFTKGSHQQIINIVK